MDPHEEAHLFDGDPLDDKEYYEEIENKLPCPHFCLMCEDIANKDIEYKEMGIEPENDPCYRCPECNMSLMMAFEHRYGS